MGNKIYIPYILIHAALYSDKHDELGYIWGDKRRGDDLKIEEWVRNLGSEFNSQNSRNVGHFLTGGNIGYFNKKYGVLEYKEMSVDNINFDFYLTEVRLLIEVDGDFYHGYGLTRDDMSPMQKKNTRVDEQKNKWALTNGIPILRIWEHDINKNPSKVMEMLKEKIGFCSKKVLLEENKKKRH